MSNPFNLLEEVTWMIFPLFKYNEDPRVPVPTENNTVFACHLISDYFHLSINCTFFSNNFDID